MIDAAPEYIASTGKVKLALLAELLAQGVPTMTAVECANDCVQAGEVPDFWREKMGAGTANAINKDLARLKAA